MKYFVNNITIISICAKWHLLRSLFFFLCLLSILFFKTFANASEIPEGYRPVRSMGMGGLTTLFPNETDAVILNPAALRWVEGINWEIVNIGAGINGTQIYTDLKAAGTFSSAASYNNLFGVPIWVGANGKTSFALPYFGFAFYGNSFVSATLHSPAYPHFNMNFISDTNQIVGGAFPIGPLSSIGLSVKRVSRWGGEKLINLGIIASGNSTDIINSFDNKGDAFGADIALMTKVDGFVQPTASFVWHDVGSTKFTKTAGTDSPPRIQDNMIAGLGLKVDLPGLDFSSGFEYHHINLQGEQLGKKLHFGTELSVPLIDLRFGINQGYFTYGGAVDFWFLRTEASFWKEEIGEYPGQTPQERFMVSVTLQVGFDANFNVTDSNGHKRRLKQRR